MIEDFCLFKCGEDDWDGLRLMFHRTRTKEALQDDGVTGDQGAHRRNDDLKRVVPAVVFAEHSRMEDLLKVIAGFSVQR